MAAVDNALNRPDRIATQRVRRMPVRTLRPRWSWAMFVTTALVLGVAGCAAVEVATALAGSPLRVLPLGNATEYSGEARWRDPSVLGAAAILAVIGVLLSLLAFIPSRGMWAALCTDDPARFVGLARPALCRALLAAAREVPGVQRARVSVRFRRVRVTVRVDTQAKCALRGEISSAVERRLTELVPLAPLCDFTISTRVRPMKRPVASRSLVRRVPASVRG